MHYPVHIRFTGMESSLVLITAAKTHACGLTWAKSKVIECWVGVHFHPEQSLRERPFSVRIDVLIPGHELSAQRAQYTDVHLAMGHAFEDMAQQLKAMDAKIAEDECAVTVNGQIDVVRGDLTKAGITDSSTFSPHATHRG